MVSKMDHFQNFLSTYAQNDYKTLTYIKLIVTLEKGALKFLERSHDRDHRCTTTAYDSNKEER